MRLRRSAAAAAHAARHCADPVRFTPHGICNQSFGNALHVSGTDRAALEAALAALREGPAERPSLTVREVAPSLEDVFIHLMRDVGEAARPARQPVH